jgi:hypothetical protein
MATIPPGGIVTIPDPVSGGAGAPVTTTQIINAMWENAQNKSAAGDLRIGQAIGFADPAPNMTAPTLDMSYLPPTAPDLPIEDPGSSEALYNSQRDQLINLITTSFTNFIDTYFPNPQFYEDALQWCHDAFTTGGTGLNPDVEQQLWERGRARILADSERAEAEAMETWANRRWPVPPGALTNQINQIRLDSGRKLAEQSRDISIKSFDTEIENIRFAIKEVIDQRKVALDAAGDYIKTIMLGPDTAMKLVTGLAGIKTQFANALVALYSAQIAATDPKIRLQLADANLKLEAEKANLQAKEQSIEQKVRAATSGAQLVAQQASAGLNAINAQASISGQDVTST